MLEEELKYKVTIFRKQVENVSGEEIALALPIGPPMFYDSVPEAFASAIVALKLLVRNGEGDIFLMEKNKKDMTTIVTEITDESLLVEISPNILSSGIDKIGPYCSSHSTWMHEVGEA